MGHGIVGRRVRRSWLDWVDLDRSACLALATVVPGRYGFAETRLREGTGPARDVTHRWLTCGQRELERVMDDRYSGGCSAARNAVTVR